MEKDQELLVHDHRKLRCPQQLGRSIDASLLSRGFVLLTEHSPDDSSANVAFGYVHIQPHPVIQSLNKTIHCLGCVTDGCKPELETDSALNYHDAFYSLKLVPHESKTIGETIFSEKKKELEALVNK